MAHATNTKARALAMLILGNSPRYVSQQTGVPLTTVRRWRNRDMRRLLREIFPHGVAWAPKMALKKGNLGTDRG